MANGEDTPLLTKGDLDAWKQRAKETEDQIAQLTAKLAELENLIELAKRLSASVEASFGRERGGTTPIALPTPSLPKAFENQAKRSTELTDDSTFPEAVQSIVSEHPSGITIPGLRAAIDATPLGERLRQSDKGFYHATSRLRNVSRPDHLVEYRGHFFTQDNLKAFQARVDQGVEADKPEWHSARRGSAMTDEILQLVTRTPGITAKDVVSELIGRGFTRSANSAFNAIARMKKLEELQASGDRDRGLALGPNAPHL